LEQSTLKESISNLRAEIEGLRVRKENFENRKKEIENRISKNKEEIPSLEKEIEELKNESPLVAKKQEELKKKKQELENLEEEKKKMYSLKTELNSLKERMKEKENRATKISAESDSLLKRVEELSSDLKFNDYESCLEELNRARESIKGLESELEVVSSKELEMEKIISVSETKISEAEKVKGQIQDIDTCPLCQNKMTEEHSTHVNSDSNKKISEAQKEKDESEKEIESLLNHKQELSKKIFLLKNNLQIYESELPKHNAVIDKQEYVKKLVEEEKILKDEINNLANRRSSLETKSVDSNQIEERYGNKLREIEEISSRTEKDLDQTLMFKNRDLESTKDIIKRGIKDLEEITIEISELSESLESKSNSLKLKEEDEEKLNEKFKKMFEERDLLQTKIHEESMNLSEVQNYCRQIEDQLNDQSLMNARLKAQKEAFEMDLPEFDGVEIIQASKHVLEEKLQKSQAKIQGIGSINMRALEVYGDIKKEYDRVTEKVETLEREKEQIMKIIEEIDRKKKRTFMRTFRGINDLFSSIFSDLCMKGKAYLEIENKDDIFSGGVNIIIKLAKGKYFDVTSLSGGEQSLIALSLLFAIQEFKPYHFYIFDEIDAALDKRNSERLASRLKKYMKSGQYIIVTHNDAIISDSDTLYGVSMHEGVSKVLSIKV
jgi:chromosome segregation protein